MYSWKTIRAFCAVLLLLPLAHLAILLARESMATMESSPTVWQNEVDRYIRQDDRASLPDSPLVVIGGRRASLWPNLASTVSPMPLILRSLGNAIVDDFIYYHDRMVSFYRPAAVVLLPGSTEFHHRANNSAGQLVASIKTLVDLDTSLSKRRRFYVFAPIKTPLHREDWPTIDAAVAKLAKWGIDHPAFELIDPNPLLSAPDGTPDSTFFRSEGIQLNDAGYLRLDMLLRQALVEDFPAVFSPTTSTANAHR
ncbi:hypothetical protein FV139_04235 [Parahaliea maris]|uniref:SGNH hydrolase-type esterase domain-containing protein n=1 Tax=Parahaliea maris TaxID=2716870 RepID=A0A5C9A6V2_9GAMM|nr:hypothetical protein [Parahaliea maris]TXS96685.1 hypothetical protein FV139_04235 [Parahaliea maris]